MLEWSATESRKERARVYTDSLFRFSHVLDNVERPYLLKLKDIFDEQVKIATAETEKLPFAISHRILQIYISRWSVLSKCLDYVANPHNPYGPRPRVVNLPNEEDDRKRKANRSSLTASSPSVDEDARSGAQRRDPDADDNMDRQNPKGSGGNLV